MPIAEALRAARARRRSGAREAEVVGELLEAADGGAIALGGGSVLSQRVRDALARHVVVWLQVERRGGLAADRGDRATAAPAAARTSSGCSAERLPIYESLADAIVMPPGHGLVERALPAIAALARAARGDQAAVGGQRVRRVPGARRAGAAGARLVAARGPPVLRHRQHRGGALRGAARAAGAAGSRSSPASRRRRSPWRRGAARAGRGRDDAIRPRRRARRGVVGDLAGFCAATYQRGVPVVHVPTTLVAQVDSAYGGKTGVDLPEAKNYVGAYHQPAAVLRDTSTLRTLPEEELAAGFVEVLKTAPARRRAAVGAVSAIRGAEELTPRPAGRGRRSPAPATSARSSPPTSATAGCGRSLNLGHTVGHAIEAATGYGRYRHGEAVGLGLLAALRLSDAETCAERSAGLLARFGLPGPARRRVDLDAVLAGGRARQEADRRRGPVRAPRRSRASRAGAAPRSG